MAIKESSDELNPPVVATDSEVSSPRAARSWKDYLALGIGTCGVGYIPIAPGTFGSILGIGLFLLLNILTLQFILVFTSSENSLRVWPSPVLLATQLMLITGAFLAGVWASSRAEGIFRRKDSQKLVIDEVAGQLIALLPLSLGFYLPGWSSILVAFLLFRFFDIVKPFPARQLEMLPAGLGVMADDIVAGAYAAVGVSIIIAVLEIILI